MAEFCRSLAYSRWRIAEGRCREFGGRPYGPILDALSTVETGAQPAPAESKEQYFEAIARRVAEISSRKALVLVIEDLHWADAATLDLLAYLGSNVTRMRVLILASFRPGDLHDGHPAAPGIEKIARYAHAGRIDLPPLDGVELRTFIDEALEGFNLNGETRRAIAQAGEGNPFFTEELLKNAVHELAERPGTTERTPIAHSIRATLLERLRPFENDDRRIITQAAVIGRTFTLELLATVVGVHPDALISTLRRARDFQLIEELEPSVFRFRHGLTREAICGDFLRAELHPIHRRIALSLESVPEPERSVEALAYHWWAAGDEERCLQYNDLAGDRARTNYAYDDAIASYERALTFKNVDALRRGTILEKIAHIRLVQSLAEEAEAVFVAAAEAYAESGAFEREAVCRVRAAMTAYTIRLCDTSGPLEAMLRRLDAGEFLARARLNLGLAWLALGLRFQTRAREHLCQVDPRAPGSASDLAVRYHNVAAGVATAFGDAEGLRREHAAWLEAARAHGAGAVAGAHYNGAKFFASFGLHDEARENIRQALHVARESRNRHAEECAHATSALCYVLSGDLQGAREAAEMVSPATDNRVNITFATAAGTAVGAHLGDEAMIEKWFDGFERTILDSPEIECGYAFAEVMVRRGRHGDAQELLHRVLPLCELIRGEVPTLLAIARHGRAADRLRAREYLVRAAATGDSLEGPALALFDAIEAMKAEREADARRLALEAAEGFRRFHTPLLEAEAREMAGDSAAALALYRQCGAAYHVRRLDASSGGAQLAILSDREREIVTLAAEGQSNLEIAGSLFISHKTVEKHLGSAYQKLGVSSRRALRTLK
jgi:DNA-binding CsgD family transcriptional regulator